MTKGSGAFLEIEFRESDFHFWEVRVTADCHGFAGHSTVFLRLDALREFADRVAELDKTRHGSVELESAEPVDFRLYLFSLDRAGHVGLRAEVSSFAELQVHHFGEWRSCDRVLIGFQLDPAGLQSLVRWCQGDGGILRLEENRT